MPEYLGDPKIGEMEKQLITESPMIEITPQQAMDLARQAACRCEDLRRQARAVMGIHLAATLKQWRKEGSSLRDMALNLHDFHAFSGAKLDWEPPNNQIAGLAFCLEAAMFLGENAYDDPWSVA